MAEDQSVERNSYNVMDNQQVHPTFIDLRLNTHRLMNDIEVFLSGKRLVLQEDTAGNLIETYSVRGKNLANETGITGILNILRISMLNEQIVQGNIKQDDYYSLIVNVRKELTEAIVVNCYEWDIADNNLNLIIDTLVRFFRLFISRTIDNKERESYSPQFQTREIYNPGGKKSLLQNFSDGFK